MKNGKPDFAQPFIKWMSGRIMNLNLKYPLQVESGKPVRTSASTSFQTIKLLGSSLIPYTPMFPQSTAAPIVSVQLEYR